MEPDGWVVAGLPANIYAIVAPQLVDGTLLGQPATVRFTPIRYHWDYGDGTGAVRSTKGGTWAALGLREFDPTPTSHVYLVEGEYTIRLTIDFRAEYRFAGSDFLPIDGTINLRANDLHVSRRRREDGARGARLHRRSVRSRLLTEPGPTRFGSPREQQYALRAALWNAQVPAGC